MPNPGKNQADRDGEYGFQSPVDPSMPSAEKFIPRGAQAPNELRFSEWKFVEEIARYLDEALSQPKAKPSIPKVIVPNAPERFGNAPPWWDNLRFSDFNEDRAKAALTKFKANKFGWSGPWALGFQFGWELGDYLFPNGFYDFGVGTPVPDESVGPEGWVNPKWNWYPCAVQCTYSAQRWYDADFPLTCPTNCDSGFVVPGAYSDPETAHANQVSHPIDVFVTAQLQTGPSAGRYVQTGQLQMWDYPNDGEWTQEYVPGTGTPARAPLENPRPSEHPELFPMEWPMHMPYPQKFSEALPARHSQGEEKHRRQADRRIPQLPLSPFPIAVVVPPVTRPGENVPPPPEQVITIPPPGEGPPTYHTRPPSGRVPPKGPTKESPKLNVRTVGGRVWVMANLATEAFDFVDALFQGLPKECQDKARATVDYGKAGGGKADPYAKARAIYDCFERMDWSKFVNAFINQQIEDMVVGMTGMAAQRALKVSGAATGSGGIVSRPSKYTDEYIDGLAQAKFDDGEFETRAEMRAWARDMKKRNAMPIPKVAFNEESGVWEVSIEQWGLTFY